MPLTFPSSRKEVSNRMKSDVQNELTGSNPFLRNSFLGALIVGIAGRVFDFYFQLNKNLLPNLFPDTAEGTFLERWGSYMSITRNPATQASGFITATGTDTTQIPADTELQTSDGIVLKTQALATIAAQSLSVSSLVQSGGVATATTASNHNLATGISVTISGANESDYNGTFTITVTGLDTFTYTIDVGAPGTATGTILSAFTTASIEVLSDDFGQDANVEDGASITFSTPIAGVDDTAVVQFDEISGGSDEESDVDLRVRILSRYKNPVALFNVDAIENQAKLISGVTRVWVEEATPAAGQVTTYFTRDNDASSIPSASEVTTVKTSILLIKPAHTLDADVIVSAPTPVSVDFTFSALSPNTTTMQEALQDSLEQLFSEDTEVGSDLLEAQYLGAIINTIDPETGIRVISFTLSTPTGNVSISAGEIATLGNVTF